MGCSHSEQVMSTEIPSISWGKKEAEAASVQWGFNCGPAALCAVTGMTPEQVRPHLIDFEQKGYTNPTMMLKALESLQVPFRTAYRSDTPGPFPKVDFGLVRLQWGGPWTRPGVPPRARYRKTHWAAAQTDSHTTWMFDINSIY